eukprot:maker-scaffold_5-snap-gene-12.52-mRNA-1 protein AED:0.01 eAED:0.01 QI:9/0.75/0.8/1/1/1/5/247/477
MKQEDEGNEKRVITKEKTKLQWMKNLAFTPDAHYGVKNLSSFDCFDISNHLERSKLKEFQLNKVERYQYIYPRGVSRSSSFLENLKQEKSEATVSKILLKTTKNKIQRKFPGLPSVDLFISRLVGKEIMTLSSFQYWFKEFFREEFSIFQFVQCENEVPLFFQQEKDGKVFNVLLDLLSKHNCPINKSTFLLQTVYLKKKYSDISNYSVEDNARLRKMYTVDMIGYIKAKTQDCFEFKIQKKGPINLKSFRRHSFSKNKRISYEIFSKHTETIFHYEKITELSYSLKLSVAHCESQLLDRKDFIKEYLKIILSMRNKNNLLKPLPLKICCILLETLYQLLHYGNFDALQAANTFFILARHLVCFTFSGSYKPECLSLDPSSKNYLRLLTKSMKKTKGLLRYFDKFNLLYGTYSGLCSYDWNPLQRLVVRKRNRFFYMEESAAQEPEESVNEKESAEWFRIEGLKQPEALSKKRRLND